MSQAEIVATCKSARLVFFDKKSYVLRILIMSRVSSYQEERGSCDAFVCDAYALHSGATLSLFCPSRGSRATLTPAEYQ